MAEIAKFIFLKNFNADLLDQEVSALTLSVPIDRPHLAGFDVSNNRARQPASAPLRITKKVEMGVLTEDFADPGEVRITSEDPISAADSTAITGALTAHDARQLSVEQVRSDKDDTEFPRALNLLSRANWDALNNPAKTEALRRICQLLLRGNHTREIDVDD